MLAPFHHVNTPTMKSTGFHVPFREIPGSLNRDMSHLMDVMKIYLLRIKRAQKLFLWERYPNWGCEAVVLLVAPKKMFAAYYVPNKYLLSS